jgi:hypothetical protein
LRLTGKARHGGKGSMSMIDPAYHVIEEPVESREETGDTG